MNRLFNKILARAKSIYSAYKHIIQIKWVRYSLQSILILASLTFLVASFRQYRPSIKDIQINYWNLIASFGVVILTTFIGALIWWLLLRSLDQTVDILDGSRVHIVSNIAKYLPGYAWQLVGKSYLTLQQGVPGGVVVQGLSFEFSLLIAVGIAFGLLMIPSHLLMQWPITRAAPGLAKVACVILSLALLTLIAGLPYIIKRGKIKIPVTKIAPKPYLISIAIIFFSWCCLSFAFWLLGGAFAPNLLSNYPTYAFALTTSILVGLAILFVPNGFGVRESLMVILLQPVLTAPLAVLVATTFRLLTIFGDFFSALVIVLIHRRIKRAEIQSSQ